MKSKAKIMRSANWDSSDKILLRQLIEERIEIVENKSVDTNTIVYINYSTLMKRNERCGTIRAYSITFYLELWRVRTDDNQEGVIIFSVKANRSFSNMSATTKETSQLQSQWRTIKMKVKTKHSTYKRSLQTTGGGPPPESPDAEDDKLMALIPQEFEEDENIFDCDTHVIQDIYLCAYKQIGSIIISPSHPPPALDTSNRKKKSIFKRKINCKDDEHLKKELFNTAVDNRRAEKIFMEREHEEKMKSILMERNEKIKTLQMERA